MQIKLRPNQSLFLALFSLVFILFSCKKDEKTDISDPFPPSVSTDCSFVQNDEDMDGLIDEAERAIMEDCFTNRFTSKSEIEANLIGEWQLVGHGEGWIPTVSQPCGYIIISEDELIFDFETGYYDSTTVHTWELVAQQNNFFGLEVTPIIGAQFYMNIFCENYMYSDATPSDGNMYLYQKVE